MDVRERLVELVGAARYWGTSEEIADNLLENGVTVQEWISVKDRLPDVGSRVIACGEKGGVFVVKSEGKTTGFGRMDGASKYRSFDHWMPLPQPPKGE